MSDLIEDSETSEQDSTLSPRPYLLQLLGIAALFLVLFGLIAYMEMRDSFWEQRAGKPMMVDLEVEFPIYPLLKTFDDTAPRQIPSNILWSAIRLLSLWSVTVLIAALMMRKIFQRDFAQREVSEVLSIFETRSSVQTDGSTRINGFEALNRLGDYLHRYHQVEEIHQVIRKMAMVLFPMKNGAFYTFNEESGTLDLAVSWGTYQGSRSLLPHECAALATTKMVYLRKGDQPEHRCEHFPKVDGEYLCIPIMGMGKLLGLFHLQRVADARVAGGAVPNWISVARAFADRVGLYLSNLKLQADYQNQVLRDPLTRIYNGRFLEETLDREIHAAKRRKGPLGLLLIDLDHFQDIGQVFGRGAVESFLFEIGRILVESVRLEDVCCRFKDGEFGVLLPGASMEITKERAEGVRTAVEKTHLSFGDNFLTTTISIGMAVYPDHGESRDGLMLRARKALQQAKDQGRNCTVIAEQRLG